MVFVFTIYLDANEAFGFRLVEERRKSPTNPSEVEIRAKIGYKGPHMRTWQWELVTGFTLEDVMAAIRETKESDGVASLRFFRPDRKPEDGWTCSFGEDLLIESSIKRGETVEKKKSEAAHEITSVRVGIEYQCDTLPPARQRDSNEPTTADEKLVYSCFKLSPTELEEYLAQLFGESTSVGEALELALTCLHSADYDKVKAVSMYQEQAALIAKKEWSDEKKQAFETAMARVGCRDFRAVQFEMAAANGGELLPVGEIVSKFYADWKCKPAYQGWVEAIKKSRNQHPRKCYQCGGGDPYLDAIKCSRCYRHCHLECMDPPVVRIMQSSTKWSNWVCDICARPPPKQQARTAAAANKSHVGHVPSPHNSTPPLAHPGPVANQAIAPTPGVRRSAAAAASSIWAAVNPNAWGSRGYEEDEDVDEEELEEEEDIDEDEYIGGGRAGKRARRTPVRRSSAGRSPEAGETARKIHHLKGTPIPIEPLLQIVAEKGGYDAVVANKLWQAIRKELNLPHTTSSSTQLRDAYLSYAGLLVNNKRKGDRDVPPPPPPL